jgi:hypothetical protein
MTDIIKSIKNLFMWGLVGIFYLVLAAFYLLLALGALAVVVAIGLVLWQIITKDIQQTILIAIALVVFLFILSRTGGSSSIFEKIVFILAVIAVMGVIVLVFQFVYSLVDPGNRDSAQHFFETNGSWVASDNSMRMHFFIEGAPLTPGGFSAATDVVVANLQTGSSGRIPYSVTRQNNGLEFNTTRDKQQLPGDLPANFLITEFSNNTLEVQIKDRPPVRFVKVSRPNSVEELVNYSTNYSTEEYLSVVAREIQLSEDQNSIWSYNPQDNIYGGQMTFKKNSEEKYIITLEGISLNTTDLHVLRPGENAQIIIPPLRKALIPIGEKIEAIIYTEMISDSDGNTANWTAKYTTNSNSTQVIDDTATGKVMIYYRR